MLEAARARVEGSREGLERIAFDLGIERTSLYRWKRLHGWQRPSRPERRGPCFYRSARRVGRPYGADAVGTVRDLLASTTLSADAIARRAGIGRATLYRWLEQRPDWFRHPARDTRGTRHVYPPEVIEAAHRLYRTTEFSPALIAARVGTTRDRIYHWAKTRGWTRPRDLPDTYGRVRRRGRWVWA